MSPGWGAAAGGRQLRAAHPGVACTAALLAWERHPTLLSRSQSSSCPPSRCRLGACLPAYLRTDEDDPFLGLGPKPDKKEAGLGAKDTSLDTALAMRKTTARRGMPGMAYYPLGLAGAAQRHPSLANAAAAAAAARAAAERAAAAAKAARERAAAASAAAAGARVPGGLPGYRPAPAAAGVTVHPAVGQPADPTACASAAATSQPAREARGASQPADGGAPAAPATEQEQKAEQQEDGGERHAARRTLLAALSSHLPDAPQRLPSDAAAPGDPPAPAAGDAAEVSQSAQARAAVGSGARLTLARALTTPAGASQAGGGAAAATSAAVSKAAGPSVRLGDRVSYYGRQHPTMASAQEQLEQLQAAIQRVELSSSQRARDYLPQLLVRRSLVQAQQSQRAPRVQAAGAPPLGSRGRVVGVTGDKVGRPGCRCCAAAGTQCRLVCRGWEHERAWHRDWRGSTEREACVALRGREHRMDAAPGVMRHHLLACCLAPALTWLPLARAVARSCACAGASGAGRALCRRLCPARAQGEVRLCLLCRRTAGQARGDHCRAPLVPLRC